jgi:hypothetical protein
MQALQRVERRTAEVLYQRRTWFKWVRNQQNEEETRRENEKKRVRHEAALFKRHWAQVKQHIKEMRMKEDLKRQEEYLEEAFKARMSLEEDNVWDPIEDVVVDEHGSYVDMLKLFLFMKDGTLEAATVATNDPATENPSKRKSKGQKRNVAEDANPKSGLETKSQMRERLRKGTEYVHSHGAWMVGSIERPLGALDRAAPLPEDEIDQLLEEITEIKQLLFCRILLSHASLLPVALRAGSVEEFLADKEINDADLRAICLKMENPGWQEVRDACADLVRGEEEDLKEEEDDDESKVQEPVRDVARAKGSLKLPDWRKRIEWTPQIWPSAQDQRLRKRRQRRQNILANSTGGAEGNLIDFGVIEDVNAHRGKKVRIKLCGRSIYNYPSEKAMNRGGWLHFSIIAKDSSLSDAVKLCRHWDEFFELCILTVFQFFPAGSWMEWMGNRLNQQLLQLVRSDGNNPEGRLLTSFRDL